MNDEKKNLRGLGISPAAFLCELSFCREKESEIDMSWSQASTTTGFYSGMNYTVSELGGFAGQGLVGYTKELIKKRETNKALLDMGKDTDADGNPLSKDPLGGVENFLVGMYESMCGGLGRLRDGINYIGEHVSNLGKNIWRQGNFIWESDTERVDRIYSELVPDETENVSGAVDFKETQKNQDAVEKGIKKRLGDKYGKAVSLEDAKELLKEFDQGKNGGAAKRVLEAMMEIANDDSFKFDADYADSLKTVSKELQSKIELKSDLENMIKNYNSTKAQNGGTSTVSINDLQKQLNTLTSEVTKLTNQYNAFAGLKKNFDESKAFIDKTFSSIKGMSDLQLKNISNDTAAALCCAISFYNMKKLNGYEDRVFTDWFQSEISKGNIVKGTHGTAKGVFFVSGAGRIEQTRIEGSAEPKMQRIENSGNALGSMPSQLQGDSGKYVMLWNDTHLDDETYKANHFTVGYCTGTDVINLDHADRRNFDKSINREIGWNNVYRVTKYLNIEKRKTK